MSFVGLGDVAGAVRREARSTRYVRRALLASVSCLCFAASAVDVWAQVVIEGGAVENVPGTQASPWNIGNSLTVGDNTDGTLNIGVGGVAGVVTDTSAVVGNSATATGRVNVTGAGSSWSTANNFYVGAGGNGFMTVQGGASVASATIGGTLAGSYIGQNSGSTGTVYVQGTGSVWSTNMLEFAVNDGSRGYMTISNGGRVNSLDAIIGDQTAVSGGGSVLVTGAASLWDMVGELTVGSQGTGSLNVESGGTATTAVDSYIGRLTGGNGVALVTGAGSSLNVGGTLTVGAVHAAGVLTIADGGVVNVGGGAGTVRIANGPSSSGVVSIGGAYGLATAAPGTLQAALVQFGAGGGILNFNHTASNYTFAPAIAGNGTIIQAAGHTTLATNSDPFTGAIVVNGGTLAINGSFTGATGVTVNSGGTLGGNGTVTDVLIKSGGALAPGNSIGTLNVQGNLVFQSAAGYMVEVSPANADRVNVSGTATLGGATVTASFAPGNYVAKQYVILNAAGGVTGTFNALTSTNLPAGFTSRLGYDANNVYLDLAFGFGPATSLNTNQRNVANALTRFFDSTGGIPLVFGTPTPAGLGQLSGELAPGAQQATFGAMNLFMGVMTDPFTAGRGFVAPGAAGFADAGNAGGRGRSGAERDAYGMMARPAPEASTFERRWNLWAAGFGGAQNTDGNAAVGSNAASSRIGGIAVGADYLLSPQTVAGFAMAGGTTSFNVDGSGSGRSELFQAGALLRHTLGSAYLSAVAAYAWQDVTTDRTVTVAGFDRLHAQFNASAYSGRIEAGNRHVVSWLDGLGVTPYAAAQLTLFDLPAYAERAASGSNVFALAYGARTVTDTRSEFGLRTDRSYAVNDALLTLRGRAAWAHDFNTGRVASATFQSLPGASFVVNGASTARDAALTTVSAEMTFMGGVSLAATFEGEFSDVNRSYAGKGVFRYPW